MAKNTYEKNSFLLMKDVAQPNTISNTPLKTKGRDIATCWKVVAQQMDLTGLRERTISDYNRHLNHFVKITEVEFLEDITSETIYTYLDSMDVQATTKNVRLKAIKAILKRFKENGWIEYDYWTPIKIKVDKSLLQATTEEDLKVLLSVIDTRTFFGYRDYTAVILMYQTGIRINTLGQLTTKNVDFKNKCLVLQGRIMKNHKPLKLPLSDNLIELLTNLINTNDTIRKERMVKNDYVFITQRGSSVISKSTNNQISKRLSYYAKEYGLTNINPHALRRAYATNLLKKGANVALISKGLGHADISTTTRYLDLGIEEVNDNLREFL